MSVPNLAQAPCGVCGLVLAPGKGLVSNVTGKFRTTCPEHESSTAQPAANSRLRVVLTVVNGRAVARPSWETTDHQVTWRRLADQAKVRYTDGLWLFPLLDLDAVRDTIRREADVETDVLLVTARDNALAAAQDRGVKADERLAALEAKAAFPITSYQRQGALWLRQQAGGCGQFDPAGAGKTAQVCLAIDAPVLVVCPASVKESWVNEFKLWRPELACTIFYAEQLKPGTAFMGPEAIGAELRRGKVVILNYEIMPDPWPIFPPGTTIVFDEAHKMRNRKTQFWQRGKLAAEAIQSGRGKVILVTGDPMYNKPEDLYSVLEVGDCHRVFGSLKDFREMFGAVRDRFGNYLYGMPTSDVARLLRRVMIRRPESMIENMLPKHFFEDVIVQLDKQTREACDEVMRFLAREGVSLNAALAEAGRTKRDKIAFEEISRVYAAVSLAKTPAAMELVTPLEDAGEPVVVLCAHVDPLKAFGQRDGWVVLQGSTSGRERGRMIREFQASKLRGIAISREAGGLGITLTRAKYTVDIDDSWTPAANRQGRKRVYRLGQRREVTHYRLVGDHQLDRRIREVNDEKERMFLQVVEAACAPVPEGVIAPTGSTQTLDYTPLPKKLTAAVTVAKPKEGLFE